eukprot:CAMPEP_0183447710 /NCGR_PEP_ID=MMETSP0370-20130417/103575_1 /TAXON_ID=268820 /ORGANISM="Peridinium aciculiferum, Strain PAER-2" /LENGTH=52 /DNA_ID=CAMNT_0025638595 /DNA_START=37 /DNA_END=192 /DNA_ORIENTATION=+
MSKQSLLPWRNKQQTAGTSVAGEVYECTMLCQDAPNTQDQKGSVRQQLATLL